MGDQLNSTTFSLAKALRAALALFDENGRPTRKGDRHAVRADAEAALDAFAREAAGRPSAQVDNVRTIVGSQFAYACITGPGYSLDAGLEPGRSATNALLERAAELRQRAESMLVRASRMENAAEFLAAQSRPH